LKNSAICLEWSKTHKRNANRVALLNQFKQFD